MAAKLLIERAMGDEFNYTVTYESTDDFKNGSTEDPYIFDYECINAHRRMFQFSRFAIFFAISMIFALGFIVRRNGLCLRCCFGRPGAVQPVDFVDEIGRRWAYAACFVIFTSDILDQFIGNSFLRIVPDYDPVWMKKYGWVKELSQLLDVLSLSLVYFPLLACIDHRRSIPANVLGVVYVVPWICMYCYYFQNCNVSRQRKSLFVDVDKILLKVPIFFSFFIVGFSYVLDFGINVKKWRQQRSLERAKEKNADVVSTCDNRRYKIGHHLQYVENLMRKNKTGDVEQGAGVKVKLRRTASRFKYKKVFGFRYSTRMICSMTICTSLLIWIECDAIRATDYYLYQLSELCTGKGFTPHFSLLEIFNSVCSNLLAVRIACYISSAFTTIVVFIMLIHTLITYKRRWHQLLRGDHSWHMLGDVTKTPHSTLLNGLQYGGYQVAFFIWGWLVLALLVLVILMIIIFAFIIPLRDGVNKWLIELLEYKWPTVLLGVILIPLIQSLICRFLFLQESGTVMALTNRRIYNAASYYFLVLNIIVGIFSCLKRILIPLVLGTVFLSRLDQPLIMHGYESMDPGYVAFVSMLIVDLYHNHPVLKAFVELMNQVRTRKENATEDMNDPDFIALRKQNLRSKIIRNRWWKIVTLANNPSLSLKALEQRLIRERHLHVNVVTQQISQETEANKNEPKQEKTYL